MSSNCPSYPTLDCNDPYSMIIQAILNLGGSTGSTADEINQEITTICSVSFSSAELRDNLLKAVRRGLLGYGTSDTTDPRYMVRSDMVRLNPQNEKYWRAPGCPGSFYTCHTGL